MWQSPQHPWSRRHRNYNLPLYIMFMLWCCFGGVPIHRLDLSAWWHLGIMLALMMFSIPLAIRWRSGLRAARREQGRLCGNCLFPLEGLPMQGACPECGHRYSIKHTIACWKHDLGLNGNYEYRHWPELPADDPNLKVKPPPKRPKDPPRS
ncbi:MAG: hypothetical protein AAF937_10045 [Planctomycetota bacterium]